MKICELCTVDFTLFHFLLPLMHGLRDQGHEVVGGCADGPFVEHVRADGYRVKTLSLRRSLNPFRILSVTITLVRFFRAEKFDIVHVHTPVAALAGRIAAKLTGVPRVVYTAHGFYFHNRMPWPKRALHIAIEWFLGRLTDTMFTQSQEDCDTARRLNFCADTTAIGNGSDPARFHPTDDEGGLGATERASIRRELDAGDADIVVLMIGRLVAEKGYRELFAAFRSVPAQLWVAGDRLASDHASSIAADIARVEADSDLGSRVKFIGYRSDIAQLMRAADIFVLPSHREGMPRSIIEAMLSGLPVVATNIRGSREEVIDGATGYLVPLGDVDALAQALTRLAKDGALRRQLGAAGRTRAREEFDEHIVVQRQLDHLGLVVR